MAKITVSSDDLHSPKVEERLQQQEAVTAAQTQYQNQAPSALDLAQRKREEGSLLFSTVLNMAVFGLIGGVLAWGCSQLRYSLLHNLEDEAVHISDGVLRTNNLYGLHRITEQQNDDAMERLRADGKSNPYFQLTQNGAFSDAERLQKLRALRARDHVKAVIADMLYYGACGMMIAMALGAAEPISSRNFRQALTNGAAGAVLGLAGGVVVSLFANRLYAALVGGGGDLQHQILAHGVSWGVLGLFLSIAPGIIMRNGRKFIFGMIGGFIGGVIGGVLFEPVGRFYNGSPEANNAIGRLVAMIAIGLVSGAATGVIENAAKAGWMRVTAGLIAGKQFILYRNPTFIGSSPACQIYLFKDARIGKRHAAVHIQAGGYFLEDLGTGSGTLVNGHPIARLRLRHGDKVEIGSTAFVFREKLKTA